MDHDKQLGLSDEELAAESVSALPDKEVVSILDLNADINLAIDAAAPIDLAAAANANVAAPIDGAVGANILSEGSTAEALGDQNAAIDQGITADATAHATQGSLLDQASGTDTGATDTGATDGTATTAGTTSDFTDGNLLDANVNVDANAGIAAPINGAVAANANVAAPIDAAVGANVGSVDSHAVGIAQQDATINQDITGSADATSDQSSQIQQ